MLRPAVRCLAIFFVSAAVISHAAPKTPIDLAPAKSASLTAAKSPAPQMQVREALLKHGTTLIGAPYRWGGMSPKGFDCSGFVSYLYREAGHILPRSSQEQFSRLPKVDAPEVGDLVFFRGKNGRITHVGMYVGEGKMIHAPQSGERVRIESMEKPNWKRRYAGARRVLQDNNARAVHVAQADAPKNAPKNDTSTAKSEASNPLAQLQFEAKK